MVRVEGLKEKFLIFTEILSGARVEGVFEAGVSLELLLEEI